MAIRYIDQSRISKSRVAKNKNELKKKFIIRRSLLILAICYLIVILIPKPTFYYEKSGSVMPLYIKASNQPRTDYHPYRELEIDENGNYLVEMHPDIVIKSMDFEAGTKYQTYFYLENINYVYERLREITGVELLGQLSVIIRTDGHKIGGGYASHDTLFVRTDPYSKDNFDKSNATSLITHELVHVLHIQHITRYEKMNRTSQRWFLEGTALYFDQPSKMYFDTKKIEYLRFPILEFLKVEFDFGDISRPASVSAYKASGEFVNYLAEKYGEEKLIELVFYFNEDATFMQEFKRIYGKSPRILYLQWYFWGLHTGM